MKPEELRIALFSGNYNYVRDGANQALNRLVGYLLRQGAQVRVYSPTVDAPGLPADRRPGQRSVGRRSPARQEYRLPSACRARSAATSPSFNPERHPCRQRRTSSPTAPSAGRGSRRIPVVASVHTRFDTYLQYYNLQWLEPARPRDHASLLPALRRDRRAGRIHGRDHARPADEQVTFRSGRAGSTASQFNPERRSLEWRRAHGIGDDEMVVPSSAGWCWKRASTSSPMRSTPPERKECRLRVRGDRRRPGPRLFPGTAARRDLHRPADRRRARDRSGFDRRLLQSVDHRDVRQCHAGSDGLRPAGHGRRRDRRDQPGPGRRDRVSWPIRATSTPMPMRWQTYQRDPALRAPGMARPGWTLPRRWTGTRSTPSSCTSMSGSSIGGVAISRLFPSRP